MSKVPMTVRGHQLLEEELKRLKRVERPKVIAAIAEARSHGDLSENAEYDATREQQGFIEGRIAELESSLSIAEVIDPVKIAVEDKVVFGAHLELYDVDEDKTVNYQLVGNLESDLASGKISVESPIGRALLGKHDGDEVEFDSPGGKRTFEILKIEYR